MSGPTVRAFPTFEALLAYARGAPEGMASREESNYRTEWTGTPSLEAAFDLARNGWRDGLARMRAARRAIDIPRVPARVMRYGPTGDEADIGRLVAGDPDCMLDWHGSGNRAPRLARVVVNVAASAGVPPETMASNAANLAAVIDYLEARRVRVELVVAWATHEHETFVAHAVAKHAGQHLHGARLAFACGHPSMLRRIMFAVIEQEPRAKRFGVPGCYGTPVDVPDGLLPRDIYFRPDDAVLEELWEIARRIV